MPFPKLRVPKLLWSTCMLAAALTASAQSSIQDLLGLGSSADSGGASSIGSSVFKSAAGEWRLLRPASSNGLDCAVGFKGETGVFALIGPTSDAKGALLFIGAKLRPVTAMTETRVALITDKDPAGHKTTLMNAFQLPSEKAAVAISTDMAATLRGISDVKRVALRHNEVLVFDLATDGLFAARDALAQCMGMPPIGKAR